MFAQQLGNGQHQIRRRHAFAQLALEVYPDHIRRQEIYRLAEHARFRLDAADAPADHADAVDHGGVTVRADQRIGIINAVFLQHAARQIFEIDLMHDADAGRHHLEGVERLHAPFNKFVAFGVALEFQLHVKFQGIRTIVVIHLHRVIYHQIDRYQRLDDLRVFTHHGGGIAHRGEVNQQRHTGEILQHDACDDERNFFRARCIRLPVGQLADMRLGNFLAVVIAQHRFQHNADRNRQARNLAQSGGFQCGQGIQCGLFAAGELERCAGVEQIMRHMKAPNGHDKQRRDYRMSRGSRLVCWVLMETIYIVWL